MQELLGDNTIREVNGKYTLAYIFEDKNLFDYTEYQVMKNQPAGKFLPCRLAKYNGRHKLVYFVEGLMPMNVFLQKSDGRTAVDAVCRVLQTYMDVGSTGFLDIDDIDCRVEHIYIDPQTNHIFLMYLPICRLSNSASAYKAETELRNNLSSALREGANRTSWEYRQLMSLLGDSMIVSLEMLEEKIHKELRQGYGESSEMLHTEKPDVLPDQIMIRSTDGRFSFVINKNSYILGKKPEIVDGLIMGVPTISRKHCKITKYQGHFYVEDLKSLNNTWVNNKKLVPGEKVEIKITDRLRLSDLMFVVQGVK